MNSRRKMTRFMVVILLLIMLAVQGFAGQQFSTGELKKVVYSGWCRDYPQHLHHSGSTRRYWARISIPELRLQDMPMINVYDYYSTGGPSGWAEVEVENSDCRVIDGLCYLLWKKSYVHEDGLVTTSVYRSHFKIVVIYEADTTSIAAQNTGTGKSVELDIVTDEETTKKIRGYKVYRREKADE